MSPTASSNAICLCNRIALIPILLSSAGHYLEWQHYGASVCNYLTHMHAKIYFQDEHMEYLRQMVLFRRMLWVPGKHAMVQTLAVPLCIWLNKWQNTQIQAITEHGHTNSQTDTQTSHMAWCVTFAVARIRVGNRRNFAYFSLWHPKYGMGDRGSKKAYTGPRTGIYLPTKFGCDRSTVVGCRLRNDRQTDKQNGMTIRLTPCERDATVTDATDYHTNDLALNSVDNDQIMWWLDFHGCLKR